MFALGETGPVSVQHTRTNSSWILVCEHAGNRIPDSLGTLGLDKSDLNRHIAWDIGILGVAEKLRHHLDATLITQPYSRLVIDCNRHPDDPELVTTQSDGTTISGNQSLTPDDRQNRIDHIHTPFHACIETELDRGEKVLVTLHSFTPAMTGAAPRPWHIGVIYNRERRLANSLLRILSAMPDVLVGDNEPYSMNDDNVYTIPYHAERRGIHTVEIEIRQDLITDEKGQDNWAALLARVLDQALGKSIEPPL